MTPQGGKPRAAACGRAGFDERVSARGARGVEPALRVCGGLPIVLALETLDAARRVDELLLAGEEGVTLGAYLHTDLRARGARMDDLTTVAGDRRVDVVGMNACLHGPTSSM